MHNLNDDTSKSGQRSAAESLGFIHTQHTGQQFNLSLPQNASLSIGGLADPIGPTSPATPMGLVARYLPGPAARYTASNQGIPQAAQDADSLTENFKHRDNKVYEDNYKKKKNDTWNRFRHALALTFGPVGDNKRRTELDCIKLATEFLIQ